MKSFYQTYPIVARPVRQLDTPPDFCLNIPWGHNVTLLERVKNLDEREWYAKRAVEIGCSRPVLEMWIDSKLHLRQGKDNLIVEYALRNNSSPISVANFETQLAKALPDDLKATLPTVEEIEAELERSLQNSVEAEKT